MTALLTAEELRDIEERAWIRRRCPVCEGVIDLTRACAQCTNRGHIYVVHEDTDALLAHIKELTRERDETVDVAAMAARAELDYGQRLFVAEAQVKELTKALEEEGELIVASREALREAEAILGGEYGDHYGVLCELILRLDAKMTSSAEAALARHRSSTGREEEK